MTTRCSYGVVDTIEREGVDCIVIYFDGGHRWGGGLPPPSPHLTPCYTDPMTQILDTLPFSPNASRGFYDEAKALARANPGKWVEVTPQPGILKPPLNAFRGFKTAVRKGVLYVQVTT